MVIKSAISVIIYAITVISANLLFRLRSSSKFDYGHHYVIFPSPISEKLQMSAHSTKAINTIYTFLSQMRHLHMTESVRVSRANQF